MQPPRLLILKRLLGHSCRALTRLAEIRAKLPSAASESYELQGYFVLTVSTIELMLTDTYLYFFRSFPEAFDFKDVQFSKDDILSANLSLDLIEQQVEKNAIKQAYASFPEQLSRFVRALGVADPPIDSELVERIVEVKETRNVLLHNNLRVNSLYVARAGRRRRQGASKEPLPLPQKYVLGACEDLQALIQELQDRLTSKFASYTRIAALRRLWEYLFSSPVMLFDDFWVLDEAKDRVVAFKKGQYEEHLANSERIFLSVWRGHFNGWRDPDAHLLMYSLDDENRQKVLWLLSVLVDFNVR